MQNIKNHNLDSITFIIPAYNDEATIETVIGHTFDVGRRLGVPFGILVVNDASTDNTGAILKTLSHHHTELTIITHRQNAGYGETIKELYEKSNRVWLFSLPGDYQIDPAEVMKLWPHRRDFDMIIGWRTARRDSNARLRQSGLYNGLLRLMFHLKTHDTNSGRLMKTSIMNSVKLTSSSAFVDAELVIRAIRGRFRVTEIPIAHRARAGAGASGGKPKIIIPTIIDMLRFWL
jgi:glycosyltransferase involved in cell wall biosynthesis